MKWKISVYQLPSYTTITTFLHKNFQLQCHSKMNIVVQALYNRIIHIDTDIGKNKKTLLHL